MDQIISHMTWNQYGFTVILILLFYYSFMVILLFHRRLKKTTTARSSIGEVKQQDEAQKEIMDIPKPFEDTSEDTFAEVQHLTLSLKDKITEAFGNHYNRKELLDSLASLLRRYPSLNHSPFKSLIHELIASECKKHAPVSFRQEELDELWGQET